MLKYLMGALEPLAEFWNWESDGDLTPEQTADLWRDIIDGYEDCMAGELWIGITATYPAGVLPFDGVQRLREDYPALYASLAPAFIDDADHFTLHEAAGRALVIAGAGSGLTERITGDLWGSEDHTLTVSEIPAHDHSYNLPTSDLLVLAPGEAPASSGLATPTLTSSTGDGDPHNNMQPSFAVKVGVWAW